MKVKNGVVVTVKNKQPKRMAATEYVAVWVEDQNGKNERCIMMTGKEMDGLRTAILPFDMVMGRLYPCSVGMMDFFAVKVVAGMPMQLCITKAALARFEDRARANAEDIPKKGFLADMLD